MPRLPYLDDDQVGPADLVAAVRKRRGGELLALDRMLLYSPPLAEGWNEMLGRVRTLVAEHIGPDAERVPVDETGACDIDCAAARNRSVRDACDIALDDLAARRHGKDALRKRQADGRCQKGLSRFMMESPFHDVHFPLRTASSG